MNPYALYIKCDGAMDYDSKNPGGVGFEIIFFIKINICIKIKNISKNGINRIKSLSFNFFAE